MTTPNGDGTPVVVLVEDDGDLAFVLERNLTMEGYRTVAAADGDAGIATVLATSPSLIILDLMLPRRDGLRVLVALRSAGVDAPVLLLTARRQEQDKLQGFRLGADDYLTKPFSMAELIARVHALMRRSRTGASARCDVLRVGAIEVSIAGHSVRVRGRDVQLSPKAFDLLVALMRRPGEVIPRVELLRQVWGYASDVSSRTLDTHVGDLRRALEDDPANPQLIHTVWRVGYRLAADGEPDTMLR